MSVNSNISKYLKKVMLSNITINVDNTAMKNETIRLFVNTISHLPFVIFFIYF